MLQNPTQFWSEKRIQATGVVLAGCLMALLPGTARAVSMDEKVTGDIRLILGFAPSPKTIDDVEYKSRSSISIMPAYFMNCPVTRVMGLTFGLGIPYRFGSSKSKDEIVDMDFYGAQLSAGLFFRLGKNVTLEPLFGVGLGVARIVYSSQQDKNINQDGSYTDYSGQLNLIYSEGAGGRLGVFFGFDSLRVKPHDKNGDSYEAKGSGPMGGLLGAVTF